MHELCSLLCNSHMQAARGTCTALGNTAPCKRHRGIEHDGSTAAPRLTCNMLRAGEHLWHMCMCMPAPPSHGRPCSVSALLLSAVCECPRCLHIGEHRAYALLPWQSACDHITGQLEEDPLLLCACMCGMLRRRAGAIQELVPNAVATCVLRRVKFEQRRWGASNCGGELATVVPGWHCRWVVRHIACTASTCAQGAHPLNGAIRWASGHRT